MTAPVEEREDSLRGWPQPGELWSLWEMIKIDGGAFYQATSKLHVAHGQILEFEHQRGEDGMATLIAPELVEHFAPQLRDALLHVEKLGAEVTAISISEAVDLLLANQFSYQGFASRLDSITQTLRRELSITHLFILDRDQAKLFESKVALFGPDVEKCFPSAAFEIEEAGKCRALSRSTAAVFHLMRVMEVGLRATAKCLGIPDPIKDAERNWGVVLKKIKDEMDDRAKGAAGKSWPNPKDKQFFGEIYGSLDAVRVAWRNSTMHVENKYTDDEAEHIWTSVRGFMRKLAARCDERGQPLA